MDKGIIEGLVSSPAFRTLLTEVSAAAIEQALVRFGFRIADGPNEIQEDMLFLRRLRQGNPLQRLDRMELQMAEHERRDEERQQEILGRLAEAKLDRDIAHKRISTLRDTVENDLRDLKTSVNSKVDEITKADGPLDNLRKDNRNALLAILGVSISVIGVLLFKYVLP